MLFVPSYRFQLIRDAHFAQQIPAVYEKLEACAHKGHFTGFDGNSLFYEYFLAENATAAVVIVHGLSEFTRKYYELAYYFLNQGYHVFVYDQRGHGLSCRQVDQPDLIHVERFEDYVEDLSCFIDKIVRPATALPLFAYSHSMGSAVHLLYNRKHPRTFDRNVLCAPMIEPLSSPVSPPVARLALGLMGLVTDKKQRFKLSRDFDPNYPIERSNDKSPARFEWNLSMRRAEPNYQSTPMTLNWVLQSLKVRRPLLKSAKAHRNPILLLSAADDRVVSIRLQRRFAEKCPVCVMRTHANTAHGVLAGTDQGLQEHISWVLQFFADGSMPPA